MSEPGLLISVAAEQLLTYVIFFGGGANFHKLSNI